MPSDADEVRESTIILTGPVINEESKKQNFMLHSPFKAPKLLDMCYPYMARLTT